MTRRRIELEGQPNFRDIGGYVATDGRVVRWGAVYRSGALGHVSASDEARLAELGLKTVVDLRSTPEVAAFGGSYLPPGARGVSIPIGSGELGTKILPALLEGDFSRLTPDLLVRVNRQLARDATQSFAELLRAVADPANRPIVFHCTQGKDRTGFGAALILAALGVAWEDIVEDYLLSNRYRAAENEQYLAMVAERAAKATGVPVEELDLTAIRPLFFVDAAAIDAARAELTAAYGSLDAYLTEALGFGEPERARLRDDLLE